MFVCLILGSELLISCMLCAIIYVFKGIFEIYLAGGSLSNIDDGDEAEVGAGIPVAVAAEATEVTEAGALYPVPTQ